MTFPRGYPRQSAVASLKPKSAVGGVEDAEVLSTAISRGLIEAGSRASSSNPQGLRTRLAY